MPECRRFPPKWWVPFQGERFWGKPAGRGQTILPCQRMLVCFKYGGGKPEGKEGEILTRPRDEKPVRSVLEHDAHSERVLFGAPPRPRRGKQSAEHRSAGHKAIKARAGNRSARVAILTYRRCQGRENFSGRCPRNFSAQLLDKTGAELSPKTNSYSLRPRHTAH